MTWLRVQKTKRRAEDDEETTAPEQIVLNTPDGNFTVFERCEPAVKRWCSLSRIHSDYHLGDMIAPIAEPSLEHSTTSQTEEVVMDLDRYEYYKKSEELEYGFEEDVELFRLTAHLMEDDYVSSQDSQDSNAEQYYTNDYPEDYWSD